MKPIPAHQLTIAAVTLPLGAFLAMVFFAPFPSDSGDFAAWVQGIGSVAAIAAAIIIDRGSARRLIAAEKRAYLNRIMDWRAALDEAHDEAGRIVESLNRMVLPEADAQAIVIRVTAVADLMDIYLGREPPSPQIGAALIGMRRHYRDCQTDLARILSLGLTRDLRGVFSARALQLQSAAVQTRVAFAVAK